MSRPARRAAGGLRGATGVALAVRRTVRGAPTPPAWQLARWATAALGRAARGAQISVLLVGPARSRALNARYRRRAHATNVLSFPASATARRSSGLLGDLVICPAVLRAEARAQGLPLAAHWAHLVVHGTLHLLGFDHERDTDARRMRRRETRTLRSLGFPDPYRTR
jgi:probable rRNA maturation factor